MALALAIDSNRYVDYCRGDAEVMEVIESAARIAVPFVVLAELRAGFRHGNQSRRNEAVLLRFLQSPRVDVLFADEATTHLYAAIYAELRQNGTPIPTHNLWIAAIAVQHDLVLYTSDAHFDRVARLARI